MSIEERIPLPETLEIEGAHGIRHYSTAFACVYEMSVAKPTVVFHRMAWRPSGESAYAVFKIVMDGKREALGEFVDTYANVNDAIIACGAIT